MDASIQTRRLAAVDYQQDDLCGSTHARLGLSWPETLQSVLDSLAAQEQRNSVYDATVAATSARALKSPEPVDKLSMASAWRQSARRQRQVTQQRASVVDACHSPKEAPGDGPCDLHGSGDNTVAPHTAHNYTQHEQEDHGQTAGSSLALD